MAYESYFAEEWKSIPSSGRDSDNTSPCFDCNICFDFARDPVVTLCGHLYCWPCIYKWFFAQSASLDSDELPNCPVCKAEISHTTVIPLYGRGETMSKVEPKGKAPNSGMVIPPRPPACGTQALIDTSNPGQQLPHRNPYQDPYRGQEENYPSTLFDHGVGATSTSTLGAFNSNVGMFGEMVYARVFGNSESLYTYRNSYHLVGSSNPRLRRVEMQCQESLNRVSIFLFCCLILCLLLF